MTRLQIYDIEYSDNLVENYQKLAQLPGFVLLQTSDRKGGVMISSVLILTINLS